MSSAPYLNRRAGGSSGCLAVLAITVLALAAIAVAGWLVFGGGDKAVVVVEGADGAAPERSPGSPDLRDVSERGGFSGSYFSMSTREAQALWLCIRESEYVLGNRAYETVARNARFGYKPFDDDNNAYASYSEENQIRIPTVTLLGGHVRAARLVALAAVADMRGVSSNAVLMLRQTMLTQGLGVMSEQRAQELFEASGLAAVTNRVEWVEVVKGARQFEAGMVLCTLAHEVGHLSLGHLHGNTEVSDEVSRNHEREADSFSFSVITSSSFSPQMQLGYLFNRGMRIYVEEKRSAKATTHPLSRERLENLMRSNPRFNEFIRANAKTLREFGLSVPDAVPSGGAKE